MHPRLQRLAPAARAVRRRLPRALALALVVLAACGGATGLMAAFEQDRATSVGTLRLSVAPAREGALDIFVPVVDWGVRFDAVSLPAQVNVSVRSVDRAALDRLAGGRPVDVERIRHEVEDALAGYLRLLVALTLPAAAAAAALVALALRSRWAPPLRWMLATGAGTAAVVAALVAVLLPPRGASLDRPHYYAHGSDIPTALRLIESAAASSRNLSEELDAQLVGLARLIEDPARRPELAGLPRLTLASDLHNNVLALPALERVARGGAVLFAGDLTDAGSPLETSLVRRIVGSGRPFVVVGGNHDSDTLLRALARAGAIVLTRRGRLMPDGSLGPTVARVGGLRIAGYTDPFLRREATGYEGDDATVTRAQGAAFSAWAQRVEGRADVIMVHAPQLAARELARLRKEPPARPLVFAMGHTHTQEVEAHEGVTVLNGGTLGAGGTGNLAEGQPMGLAVLTYAVRSGFRPFAADLVRVDPGTGSAAAERTRLDAPGEGAPRRPGG